MKFLKIILLASGMSPIVSCASEAVDGATDYTITVKNPTAYTVRVAAILDEDLSKDSEIPAGGQHMFKFSKSEVGIHKSLRVNGSFDLGRFGRLTEQPYPSIPVSGGWDNVSTMPHQVTFTLEREYSSALAIAAQKTGTAAIYGFHCDERK